MTADTTETLLFETSPFGTIDAIVEHDGRVVYFYLNERPDASGKPPGRFGMRACWVRNLQRGPLVLDKEQMTRGQPPLMPRNDCVDPSAMQLPKSENLQVVWFEEGNGAALIEMVPESQKQTIAVIPAWSGIDNFHGYALNCVHETPLAWPLPIHDSLNLRINRATEFWESFTDEASPFSDLQQQLLKIYDAQIAASEEPKYYAIDGGKFPPRGLVHYETPTETVLISVGMSLCPQPAVELSVDDPANQRRIEIGLRVPHGSGGPDSDRVEAAMSSLSKWAGYPWRNQSWLGAGHTIDFGATGSKAKLVRDKHFQSSFRDDRIGLLWIEAI